MRLVFVLFAEERRLLPIDAERYRVSYALGALHAKLQEDHARLGDRLDARFGAWAQVIALFRLLHEGIDARALPGASPSRRGADSSTPTASPSSKDAPTAPAPTARWNSRRSPMGPCSACSTGCWCSRASG
ncbi:MAG: hypothetical protein U0325_25225 [Polyangiales bacterium]